MSIVVPVYNGETFINKTVQSILGQSYKKWELLLVNDGSKDSSPAIVDDLAEKNGAVFSFHKENGGVANARNFGISKARGEFIAFCDQDDVWSADKLEKQVPLFEDPDVALVYCGATTIWKQYAKESASRFQSNRRGLVFEVLVQGNFVTCCTAVVRATTLDLTGYFDDDRALMGVDDWHLWLRIAESHKLDFVPEHLASHVFHGNNYSLNDQLMHDAEIVCLTKVRALPSVQKRSIDWGRLIHNIHIRYAKSFVFSGNYKLAGETYWDGNRSKASLATMLRAFFYTFTPDALIRVLQRSKRRLRNAKAMSRKT